MTGGFRSESGGRIGDSALLVVSEEHMQSTSPAILGSPRRASYPIPPDAELAFSLPFFILFTTRRSSVRGPEAVAHARVLDPFLPCCAVADPREAGRRFEDGGAAGGRKSELEVAIKRSHTRVRTEDILLGL